MPMVNPNPPHHSTICYRPIQPADLEILEQIHTDLFPIRYESEFFQNVVNGHDIVSWAAVDRSRPNGQSDELIGFVTARIVLVKESEIGDLLNYDPSKPDQTLVYILTLGVVESFRNLGIASALIREVIKYASSIPTCRAVYLHVISYNNPAILLYKKMSFKSPCSPLEFVTATLNHMRNGLKSVFGRLRKNEDRKLVSKWSKCKESHCLVTTTQSRKNLTAECTGYECV
ncbi:hypothetical protein ACLB2K_075457 [Fragaria x ananassa]